MQQNRNSLGPLPADIGVIDLALLGQELRRRKGLLIRYTLTLGLLALLLAFKPHAPTLSATLRVDPPSGPTAGLWQFADGDGRHQCMVMQTI